MLNMNISNADSDFFFKNAVIVHYNKTLMLNFLIEKCLSSIICYLLSVFSATSEYIQATCHVPQVSYRFLGLNERGLYFRSSSV